MPKKISAGIAIDGEKEFKKAVSDIDSSLKVMKSELGKVSAEYASNAKSAEALTAKKTVLQKSIDEEQKKVDILKDALEKSKAAYTENAAALDRQKQKVKDASDALERAKKEYGENSEEVKKHEKALSDEKKKLGEVENAMRHSKLQTDKWAEAINKSETNIHKMNNELDDVKKQTTPINKVKNALNEFSEKTKNAKKEAEKLKDAMSKIGSGISKIGGVVKQAGTVATAAISSMATAGIAGVKSIYNMAKAASEYGDAVDKGSQKLRISAEDYQKLSYAAQLSGTSIDVMATAQKTLAKNSKDLNLMDAINQVASIEDATQRAAKGAELFGTKAYQQMTPMLNSGADGIKAMYEQAEKYGLIMSDKAVKASAAFQDSLTTLQGTVTGLKNRFSADFLPSITECTDGLALLFSGDMSGLQKIDSGVSDFTDKITEMLPTVLEVGGSIVGTLVNSVVQNLPKLTSAAIPVVLQLGQSISDNLPLLLKSAFEMVDMLISGISANKGQLATSAIEIIEKLMTGFLGQLPKIIALGFDLIIALCNGLSSGDSLSNIINALIICVNQIITSLLDNLPLLLGAGIDLILALVDGLMSAEGMSNIGKAILECVKKITQTIKDKIPDIVGIGKNIIEGFWNGINEKAEWLREKISGFFGGVKDSIKKFFGINSPSRWMKEFIGYNLMYGLGEGITEKGFYAKKAMEAVTASLSDEVTTEFNMLGIAGQIQAANPKSGTFIPTVNGGSSGGGDMVILMTKMLELMTVIASNSDKQIVLDSGAAIGFLSGGLNRSLGDDYTKKKRNN